MACKPLSMGRSRAHKCAVFGVFDLLSLFPPQTAAVRVDVYQIFSLPYTCHALSEAMPKNRERHARSAERAEAMVNICRR